MNIKQLSRFAVGITEYLDKIKGKIKERLGFFLSYSLPYKVKCQGQVYYKMQ